MARSDWERYAFRKASESQVAYLTGVDSGRDELQTSWNGGSEERRDCEVQSESWDAYHVKADDLDDLGGHEGYAGAWENDENLQVVDHGRDAPGNLDASDDPAHLANRLVAFRVCEENFEVLDVLECVVHLDALASALGG